MLAPMSAATIPDRPAFQLLGQPVEIPKIEKELQNLLLDGSDSETGAARASLINLALYDENPENLERDAEILSELTSEAACRSLLIGADTRGGDAAARAWVQVHCQIDKNGKKTVCTEQISFFLSGDSPGLLRNIVFAHLDSDLPLAFWWRGEFSDAFEEGLYSRIDRLLYDSESWENPRNQLVRLREAHRETRTPFAMHDLAFTRLNAIRHAVANAFDRPSVAGALGSLSRVAIRHAEGQRMSALYLAAWIANRLGATLDRSKSSAGSFSFGSPEEGRPSRFLVSVEALDADRKGTVEVDLEMKDAHVAVSRCQTRDFLRSLTKAGDCPEEEDWLPAKRLTDASLVTDILNRAGRNRSYSQTVPVVQELLSL